MITEVLAPASTANLGPGYDRLGLALKKYVKVYARPAASWNVQTRGFGDGILPTDGRNLIAMIYTDTCTDQGWSAEPLDLLVENDIPTERGLGSSSTAVVAGVVLAFMRHCSSKFEKKDIFEIACEFEGHPDNVAPAIFGGLQDSSRNDKVWLAETRVLDPRIRLAVAIPRTFANTKKMRGLVPASFTEEQEAATEKAVETLLRGLASGDRSALKASEWDVKHQPYRFPALAESKRLYDLFRENPTIAGAFLSGAGPTVGGWCFLDDLAAVGKLGELAGNADFGILGADTSGVQMKNME